jgi:hypothetical protein
MVEYPSLKILKLTMTNKTTSPKHTQQRITTPFSNPETTTSEPSTQTPARAFLQRQSRIGMRAAARSIQRIWDRDGVPEEEWENGSYHGLPPPPTPATMENWPDTLPRAERVTSKKSSEDTNIRVSLGQSRTLKKDEEAKPNEVTNEVQVKGGGTRTTAISKPSMTGDDKGYSDALTADQQAVIDQIRTNREAVNADRMKLQKYDGAYGYIYGGKPSEDLTPKALTGTPDASTPEGKRKQAEQWIWEEMAHEGSSASINAYDSQMVTWGRGLGAKTGGLNPTMTMLMKNPGIANRLLSLGMGFKGDWIAVNLTTGAVETGKSALAIIQTDPHLLAALTEIGEGDVNGAEETTDAERTTVKQDVADAQWAGIVSIGTGRIPQFVLDGGWSKAAVQVAAHVTHWGGKYGWHMNANGYKATGGDVTKIVDLVVGLLAEKPNANGAYSVRSSGPALITNLRAWGGGAGLTAITSTYTATTLTDSDIDKNQDYNGYLIIKRGEPDKEGKLPVYTKKQ